MKKTPGSPETAAAAVAGHPRMKHFLDGLFSRYHRREFAAGDPITFLYMYNEPEDREIVALIASSLAYGRVRQILKSVDSVLARIPEPAEFIREAERQELQNLFSGFKHRFTGGVDLAAMLFGVSRVIRTHGSLNACFLEGFDRSDDTVFPALSHFRRALTGPSPGRGLSHLLPDPARGSACKRLNLFLRWMVRVDEVDPGGWRGIPRSRLIVPLDTHMHAIGKRLRFTARNQADRKTALEITSALKVFRPDDPVSYDFALTRPGILGEMDGVAFPEDI